MPYLGDYLGHLISEMTIARMQSDLEALRIADIYASDPFLRYLPVPHFRLPTVTLDVPVAIQEMEEADREGSPRGKLDYSTLQSCFAKLAMRHFHDAGFKTPETLKAKLTREIKQTMRSLSQVPEASISVKRLSEELSETAIKVLYETNPKKYTSEPAILKKLADNLKKESLTEFLKLRVSPPRLRVLVTTSELREAGPSDILAQLHLSISEEGIEWTAIESDGKTTSRLVPE